MAILDSVSNLRVAQRTKTRKIQELRIMQQRRVAVYVMVFRHVTTDTDALSVASDRKLIIPILW